jgi:hypothetical protein
LWIWIHIGSGFNDFVDQDRIELKFWILIRIDPDPQHWLLHQRSCRIHKSGCYISDETLDQTERTNLSLIEDTGTASKTKAAALFFLGCNDSEAVFKELIH